MAQIKNKDIDKSEKVFFDTMEFVANLGFHINQSNRSLDNLEFFFIVLIKNSIMLTKSRFKFFKTLFLSVISGNLKSQVGTIKSESSEVGITLNARPG